MLINEWKNLIMLSNNDLNLTGIILEGIVDNFINENGSIDFKYSFHLDTPERWNITYQKYWDFPSTNHTRKLKRGKEPREKKRLVKFSDIKSSTNVSKWDIARLKRDYSIEILEKTPTKLYGLQQLTIPDFRLRFYQYDDEYVAVIQVKYKLSNIRNELFNLAFNNAGEYPKKGKYVNLIGFKTENNPERILLYLTKIIKKWNYRK